MSDSQRIAIVREPSNTQIVIDCEARPTEIHSHRVFTDLYRQDQENPEGDPILMATADEQFCAFVEEHVRLHVSAAECDCADYLDDALAVYREAS